MSRTPKTRASSGGRVGRLFLVTAVLAIVFSVGLILGQRLLLEGGISPLLNSGDDLSAASASELPDPDEGEEPRPTELFSFYDILASPEVQDIAPGDSTASVDLDDRMDQAYAEVLDADEGIDESLDGDSTGPGANVDSDEEPRTDDGSEPARFTLQVASHPTVERARAEMDRLQSLGIEAHVVATDVPDHGKHYRVRIGKFTDEDSARTQSNRLQRRHELQTFVTSL